MAGIVGTFACFKVFGLIIWYQWCAFVSLFVFDVGLLGDLFPAYSCVSKHDLCIHFLLSQYWASSIH